MCYSFRAYDPKNQKSYATEEIFVSNSVAYYLNENSGELERNDSALLFRSTGFVDGEGKAVFEGDVVRQYNVKDDLVFEGTVDFVSGCWIIRDKKGNERKLYDYGVNTRLRSKGYENV
ncbi:hypothetical protein AVT41_gp31 [Streptococcus phage APCM01]|uniref:hypothetical protein n=1 Tax=Streptococcus phage APCM01 TaxID=1647391 RepID=UPI00067A6B1A|nr:hypothetical protein AVT41_gp31 [Streptococcus phage APCM01]AKI28592.1 hypothetical protein APCM01_031 [Streptococcus phage APCM01]